jgi:hypothetical protein
MDIADLLLLLVFIGFPLLQFVLERLGAKKRPPVPPEEESELPPLPPRLPVERKPTATVERKATAPVDAEGGWSEGWGSWPDESLEVLTAEEVVSEEAADELISLQARLPEREISEAARVTVPVVSLESLVVDRKAEHGRFHAITARPKPAPRRAEPLDIGATLRSPSELRRALIISEVLGPPHALR